MTIHIRESAAERLKHIAQTLRHNGDEQVSLERLVSTIGRRAFAMVMLTFAVFNVLPLAIIPGVGFLTSIPIMVVALQLVIGREYLWLPEFLQHRQLPLASVVRVLHRAAPIVKKLEYILRPRFSWIFTRIGIRLFAVIIFCLSFLLMLPLPFSNNILGGLLMMYALSLLEYDGVMFFIALILTITYLSFIWHMGKYLISLFT